jgi:hypothetical protein
VRQARKRQERGYYYERVRDHTRTPQPSEKRGRRRGEPVQISEIRLDCLQASGWRLKHAWIDSTLGELVPYFEYFDPIT